MKNVLITGVTGFVGANMAKRLENQYNVIGIYRDETSINSLKLLEVKNITLAKGDITCYKFIKRVIVDYDIDTVFHFAAQSIVRRAYKDPVSTAMTNIVGTINILQACKEYNLDILFTSTDKVYGATIKAEEDSPLSPVEIYGATKACADMIAQTYMIDYGLKIIITRACNIYGPGDINPRIIPNTIRSCLKSEPPVIYTDIKGIREYIYIDDIIDAYLFLINRFSCGIFNIGTGELKSQEEVVKTILKYFTIDPCYVVAEKTEKIEKQSLNWKKIRFFGWKPKVSFEEGIKRTIEWWKQIVKKYPAVLKT